MGNSTVLVSGGFDPIHVGHLRMFEDASTFGKCIVAINSDEWLLRKKGYVFMPWEDRAEIIRALDCVDEVIAFNDDDGTAIDALQKCRPTYFANGGDRVNNNTPEGDYCKQKYIGTLWNIGGKKACSSSGLAASAIPRETRPWGEFQVLYEHPNHKVKKLILTPGGKISLQTHKHRSEVWQVVKGTATIILGEEEKELQSGEICTISVGTLHRLENKDTGTNLEIIEIQYGDYLGEDDIERFEDIYNRV